MRLLVFWILYYVFKYRKIIVKENIINSFPDQPVEKIMKKFYLHLSDLLVDSILFSWISPNKISNKIKFSNSEFIDQLLSEKKGFLLMMGHFGNWEYAGAALSIYTEQKMAAVYKPLKNKFFNKFLIQSRKRFGSDLFPIQDFRKFVEYKKKGMGIIVIADQSPTLKHHFMWFNFLNRPTAFHLGPEKFAKKLDLPVIYGDLQKINKNQYELTFSWIEKNPKESLEGVITKVYAQKLEKNIEKHPYHWIWSHKRWKLKP